MSTLKIIILMTLLAIILLGIISPQHKSSHFPGGNSFKAVEFTEPATIFQAVHEVEFHSPDE